MNLNTSIAIAVNGQDGTPYKIRVDQEKERTYIFIKADLFLDADQEPVGPQKVFILENLMASEVEDWRKREKEFIAPKVEPTFVIEPWFNPTTFGLTKTVIEPKIKTKKNKTPKKDKKVSKKKNKKRKS